MSTATVPQPPELATLEIEVDGDLGTLTLNRPDSLNAMSPELIGGRLARRPGAAACAHRHRGRARLFGRGRRQLVQARPR
jgi:hypothetical protein